MPQAQLARSPPLAGAHTGGGSRQSVWPVLIHTSLGGPGAAGSLGSAVRRAGARSPQSLRMGCPAWLCLNMPRVARLRMVECLRVPGVSVLRNADDGRLNGAPAAARAARDYRAKLRLRDGRDRTPSP